jgi:L-alanine-DL-glutamate epimerase-like enolase superfamily enzyme
MSQWKEYIKEGDIIEKGYITVPDRPGIGIEMNDAAVRKMQPPASAWF